MDESELERLIVDVEEIKRAVRRNDPFVREVVGSRILSALGIPFGLLIAAFCVGAQLLLARYGSVVAVPAGWKAAGWAVLAVLVIGGSSLKWGFLDSRARRVREGASFLSVFKGIYGGPMLHLNLPSAACMVAVGAFAVWAGHPWYIIPAAGVFFAFIVNAIGLQARRPEYFAGGWFSLAASLASLFFMDGSPLICTAVIWGGSLIVFGAVALVAKDGGRRG